MNVSSITARLDTRPDRIDLRDRKYLPPLRNLIAEYPPAMVLGQAVPLYQQHKMILDQGQEGACTGFGLAATINALLWQQKMLHIGSDGQLAVNEDLAPPEKVSQRMLYHLARFYDEWPGEDYQGSSCRGAIKGWFKHGVCRDDLWPYKNPVNKRNEFVEPDKVWDIDAASRPLGVYYRIEKDQIRDMQAAILDVGAIFCSSRVHAGWDVSTVKGSPTHDTLPLIVWSKNNEMTGGHAFCLVGYNKSGLIVQNSWGENWGLSGFAVLTYDDWLENGSDAWACVMGAPMVRDIPDYYSSANMLHEQQKVDSQRQLLWFFDAQKNNTSNRLRWTEKQAFYHSITMGNDGKIINRLIGKENGRAAVQEILIDNAKAFFRQSTQPPRLVIYAHGGLNNEGASIARIRAMGAYFEKNAIYPVFFSWKTGFIESIQYIISDASTPFFPSSGGVSEMIDDISKHISESFDRTLEVACENLGAKAIWMQMKQNAAAASSRGNMDRGAFLTVLALAELRQAIPGLEIHLIGHSAGSIILGHMLDDLSRYKLKVNSCSLYAPACSADFALRHYKKAVEKNVLKLEALHVHVMDDLREQNDTVGPYGKSLLYLVSRALETQHKMPILGMLKMYDPETVQSRDYNHWHSSTLGSVRKWQAFWGKRSLDIISTDQVISRAQWKQGKITQPVRKIATAHGSFDNDVRVIDITLRRILGFSSSRKLPQPVDDLDF